MGQPKLTARQIQHQDIIPPDLDIEYDENIQILKEEQDEILGNTPDFDEEEEQWNRYGLSTDENGFATGVTFDELSSVGLLLKKEEIEPSQKELAVAIVQKIQGTELFSLLENSIEDASKKIAKLLDSKLSSSEVGSVSHLINNDFERFDIGEFV